MVCLYGQFVNLTFKSLENHRNLKKNIFTKNKCFIPTLTNTPLLGLKDEGRVSCIENVYIQIYSPDKIL